MIRKKISWSELGMAVLTVMVTAAYPWIFLYASNIKEVSLTDILFPMGELMLWGAVLFALLWICKVPLRKAGVLSAIFLFLFYNYAVLEKVIRKILPFARYWHILPTVLLLFVVFAWWFTAKAPKPIVEMSQMLVPILFSGLVVINIITAIPSGIQKMNALKDSLDEMQTDEIVVTEENSASTQPNIYLLIFDEYASFHQLEEYYGYDNKDFRDFLTEHNFVVSDESRNEYPVTNIVLTNMLNLEYVVDSGTPVAEQEMLRETPYLYTFLKEKGYSINGVGDTTWLGIPKEDSAEKETTSIEGYTLETLFLQKSMMYPLANGNSASERVQMEKYLVEMDHMVQVPNTSQFTLSYIKSPHQPFLFDEHGGNVSASEWHNWDRLENYLGQLKYITTLIEDAVDNIMKDDPNSVVIICSDHGARGGGNVDFPIEEKARILMACYTQGTPNENLMDLSGVNTLRAILTQLGLGNFDLLEVPYEY